MNRHIGLLAVLMSYGTAVVAQSCDIQTLQKINSNKVRTSYQNDVAARELCVGKKISITGAVIDVAGTRGLEFIADDGMSYHANLAETHGCGNIININKGDRISIQGVTESVIRTMTQVVIGNSICTKQVK